MLMRNTPYKTLLRIEVRTLCVLLICLPLAAGWTGWQQRCLNKAIARNASFQGALSAKRIDVPRSKNQPLPPSTDPVIQSLPAAQNGQAGAVEVGLASYYHDDFQGRITSSGEMYDANALTAAHRTYPLGAQARVTNLANGKSVVVCVNDRGPQVPERVIDLSHRAASEIDLLRSGTGTVKIEVLQ